MDDVERGELLSALLDELREAVEGRMILVEGRKDVESLRAVGIDGDFYCVQSGGGPVRAAEAAWKGGVATVILTDWDTRGDDLADRLRTNLSSLGVPYDDSFRERMARLCRPYCMDVESLHTVAARLISPLK